MCNRFPTKTVRQCGEGLAKLGLFGRSILAVWGGWDLAAGRGWVGAGGSMVCWGEGIHGSPGWEKPRISKARFARWVRGDCCSQVVYLDGVRRGWVCLVFLVLVVAVGLRSTHWAVGRWRWTGGRRSIFRIWTFVSGTFLQSTVRCPQLSCLTPGVHSMASPQGSAPFRTRKARKLAQGAQ